MTGAVDKPAAEVAITEAMVRSLLADQHPDLAGLPLVEVDAGWDNVVFRLGSDLAVRLPRRQLGAELVRNEQRWLPALAPRLPIPVPVPVRTGGPGATYPWHWSVCRWFPGASALATPPDDLGRAAVQLGEFLTALHVPAPVDAPVNALRGIPLEARTELTCRWIDQLASDIDAGSVRSCWDAHLEIPPWPGPPLWLHGDLHPHNVIVCDGTITAIVDFGDITAGDPATDLAIGWMLLDPSARRVLRRSIDVDDATWARGRGWALALGLACLANSADTPGFAALGRSAIASVLGDPDG